MSNTFVTIIAVLMEHTSLVYLGSAFGESKYPKKNLAFYILLFTLYKVVFFNTVLDTFTLVKAIFNTGSDIIFLTLLFERKKLNNAFVGLFYYILNLVMDYIVILSIVWLTGISTTQLLSNFYAKLLQLSHQKEHLL